MNTTQKIQDRIRKNLKNLTCILCIITLLFCMGSRISAAEITTLEIADQITGVDINETIIITITNNSLSSFMLPLPKSVTHVRSDETAVTLENNTVIIPLNCKNCIVTVQYQIHDTIMMDAKEIHTLSRTLVTREPIQTMSYTVELPKGHIINEQTANNPQIVPMPQSITTNGEQIKIEWYRENPNLPEQFVVTFREPEENEQWINIGEEVKEGEVWILMIVCLILGVSMGILGHRTYLKQYKEEQLPYVPSSLLSPDEKKVMTLLESSKEAMHQKELGKALNWSKSKVSAIVANLQYKELIRKEKIGRSYKVHLMKRMGE